MRFPIHVVAAAVLASSVSAQVVEIAAPTVLMSTINMSSLSAGPTTLGALANAGSNGGAPLAAVTLAQSTAQNGIYNTNPELGRALVRSTTGGLAIINPVDITNPSTVPPATYAGFDATFDVSVVGNEFGIAIGDWIGAITLEFRDRTNNALVGSFTSSVYSAATSKFFRSTTPFSRVIVRANSLDGNFVIPQLHFQTAPAWEPFGVGCPGPDGVPQLGLVTAPRINSTFSLSLSNMTPTGGGFLVLTGASVTTSVLGPLPAELSNFGAPGCLLFCSTEFYDIGTHTNGSAQFNFSIPNNPQLVGILIANQALCTAPGANALGAVMSNAGQGRIR